VVGDVTPHVYFPASTGRRRFIVLPAAGTTDPVTLTRAAQLAVASVDANVPATIRPMRDIVRENGFQWTISSLALSATSRTRTTAFAIGLSSAFEHGAERVQQGTRVRLVVIDVR
jgi:hypothetical protein